MRRIRWLMLIPALIALNATISSAKEVTRVMILGSFGQYVAPYGSWASNFRAALYREMGEPLDFIDIPLDIGRLNEPEQEASFLTFLESRLQADPVDLIVPIGAPAVRFAVRHRDRLFPRIPVLLAAIDLRVVPPDFLQTNAVIAGQYIDLPGIIEDILRMQPETTNIIVVLGSTPLEKYWAAEFRREFEVFTNQVGFTWLHDHTLEDVLQACAAAPPRSFILYGLFLMDATGIPYENSDPLRKIRAVANAPIFGYFESELGLGPVGGRLYEEIEVGWQGARIATRILKGERPEHIPSFIRKADRHQYDWRELRRWKISESRLPPDSLILFRQPGFWELYGWAIVAVILFILLETALIAGLLVSRARLRREEVEAMLLADISSRFVSVPASRVDEEVSASLRRIGEVFGIDLLALWQLDEKGSGTYIATHYYLLPGAPLPAVQLQQEDYPWAVPLLLAGQVIAVKSIHDLPPEAARERETLLRDGIKSNLSIPLSTGSGPPIGVLSLNTLRAERDWPSTVVKRMQLVAQLFTHALARRNAERALQEAEERTRNFAGRLIQAQENERSRLARELHDDLTQRLARLAIDTGRAENCQDAALAAEKIRLVRDDLVRMSEDVHDLSYRLHPSMLEDLGLAEALKAEADRFSRRESFTVDVKIPDLPVALPNETSLCLFRIAQEALRNATRHARASKIQLVVRELEGGLQLAVVDDGIGFDPALTGHRPSLGLASMRERVHLIDGELAVESAPGRGTTILAWIPLDKAESPI